MFKQNLLKMHVIIPNYTAIAWIVKKPMKFQMLYFKFHAVMYRNLSIMSTHIYYSYRVILS